MLYIEKVFLHSYKFIRLLTKKLKTVRIKMFWIKANIVDQRGQKEERKSQGLEFF